ncbi:MAG: hypothetical protein CSA34_00775 [Desulfobulbus propionicus]|nr:MAG: hypothetical protein CSA34_00775 [Desulfobulbus propionicus]
MKKSLLVLLFSLSMLGGCGYKDSPVPSQRVVPKPITDLRYQLSERGVVLYWSYPTETVTGGTLTDISSFEVYRAVAAEDEYCATCPVPYSKPVILPGGALPENGSKTASYQATLLRPGNLYFFKVRSKNGWWAESQDSNVVSFLWETPLAAPKHLNASAGDKQVQLSWQPADSHIDGSAVSEKVVYQLYRSTSGKDFVKLGEPQTGTRYTDTRVHNGRKYFYRIQAISVYKQGDVGGGFTASVEAAPRDQTPPAVPQGVRAVRTDSGVKIFWDAVTDSDLAGYRIYRRISGKRTVQPVGEVSLPYTLYLDRNAPEVPGGLYYSVSSVDKRKPANESKRSQEVLITR